MQRMRVHLSTLIVMMLGAAVLLAANLIPYSKTFVISQDNRLQLVTLRAISSDDTNVYPTIVEYREWRAGWPLTMWSANVPGVHGKSLFEPIQPASDSQQRDFKLLRARPWTSLEDVERAFPSLRVFIKQGPPHQTPSFRTQGWWKFDKLAINAVVALVILAALGVSFELYTRRSTDASATIRTSGLYARWFFRRFMK
jgi:hypothetical protein